MKEDPMRHELQRGARNVLLAGAFVAIPALAADHNEAPGTTMDRIADLDDVYAWHTFDGKIVAIVTFGGVGGEPAGPPAGYDADVLYQIHVDNDGDAVSDIDILARFGQNSAGDWGVQFEGIPGSTGTVSGAVNTLIDAGNGLSVEAGVFDDPFFFDLTGLQETIATGTVSFDSTRDAFAGKNTNALIVEMDAVTAAAGSTTLEVWATTGRK
jgi:hypothetical protein